MVGNGFTVIVNGTDVEVQLGEEEFLTVNTKSYVPAATLFGIVIDKGEPDNVAFATAEKPDIALVPATMLY